MILSPNQTLKAYDSKTSWQVRRLLGSGGQGEVYQVSDGASELALKWYYHEQATDAQLNLLRELVRRGPPSDRFLWPLDLVSTARSPDYGYLMPLREPRFKGIVDLMKRRAEPSFRALCTACFELAHHYMLLHSKGLSYRDISFGNVFFDPASGEIRICDNDNVTVNGEIAGGVAGTPRFMAPEIVRGQAKASTETDLFSLAVLLFYMLFMHHPLEGAREAAIRCLDLPAMNKLYGSEPLFIFDPNDQSNRPVPGYQDNPLLYWPIYPQFLRDLFTRAFTEGLDASRRVRENEWRKALVRLRDSIIYGPTGAENFYDPHKLQSAQQHVCWATGQPIALPPRLKIGDLVILLNADTTLAPHHIDGNSSYDFSRVVGRVIRHPSDPSIWGLKNESDAAWHYAAADGQLTAVEPGRSVTIKPELTINFGATQGEIRI
ncbi:MAG TPA: hypothetical protein VGE07_31460 [Herpetosiphonaceae bacterium]